MTDVVIKRKSNEKKPYGSETMSQAEKSQGHLCCVPLLQPTARLAPLTPAKGGGGEEG